MATKDKHKKRSARKHLIKPDYAYVDRWGLMKLRDKILARLNEKIEETKESEPTS